MNPLPTQAVPPGRSFLPKGASAGFCAAAILVSVAGGAVLGAEDAGYGRPSFVRFSESSVAASRVHDIVTTEVTDLVMVPAGYNEGYRPGMVCRVTRGGEPVAEILMVEVRDRVSAGIIVSIFPNQIIEPGDVVRVKTLQQVR